MKPQIPAVSLPIASFKQLVSEAMRIKRHVQMHLEAFFAVLQGLISHGLDESQKGIEMGLDPFWYFLFEVYPSHRPPCALARIGTEKEAGEL